MINNIINHKTQGENALMPQNGVVPFQNETLNCTVRAVVKDGEPWFVAKDVCDALEIGNVSQAVSYLDEDEKSNIITNDIAQNGDAPYAYFGRCVEVSEGCILIGEFAKILAQNGMETGQNRLFEYLRNEGIMGRHGNRHNVPAQEYIEAGYFRLTYRVIQRSDGSQQSKPTPYLTPRGQIWLMKRLGLTIETIPAA